MAATQVDFFFDPACPFTWRTSRWLAEVADAGAAEVTWRLMSLAVLNAGQEVPEEFRAAREAGVRALRVLAAAEEVGGSDAAGRLYTALGTRLHEKGEDPGDDLIAGAVADAGLPGAVAAAAGDEGRDAAVRASHDASQAAVGTDAGSPVVSIGGRGFFGPVVVPVPRGDEALRLFDAVRTIAGIDGFSELKTRRNPL